MTKSKADALIDDLFDIAERIRAGISWFPDPLKGPLNQVERAVRGMADVRRTQDTIAQHEADLKAKGS